MTAETLARTGVEMEALTAAAAGLLTIYDMCKATDRAMRIENIRLLENPAASRDISSLGLAGGLRSFWPGGWTT